MNTPYRPLRPVASMVRWAVVLFAFVLGSLAQAAEEAKVLFQIGSDDATVTLKSFMQQSGKEIMYPVAAVKGTRTNPVNGEFTPQEALKQMLAGTKLAATKTKSGVLAVTRVSDPNVNRAIAENSKSGRPGLSIQQTEEGILQLETIEVTGLAVPGLVNEGVIPRREGEALPFQVFDREAIERSGALSLAEFFRGYGGNAAQGLSVQSFYGGIGQSVTVPGIGNESIDLHGFGDNKTVVLLNGRRLYGSDTQGPDIARIPLSAIERVEVLPGSAGAIYGANAIGGVVNIILRKNYRDGEATFYVGTSTAGGGTEVRATLFQGFTSENRRFTGNATIEHTRREGIKASDRRYYLDALARVPVDSSVFSGLIPGLATSRPVFYRPNGAPITQTGTLFAVVPAGYSYSGAPLTFPPASVLMATDTFPTDGPNRIDDTYLQPPETITSANFQGEYSIIKDRLGFYTELSWRQQELDLYTPSIVGNTVLSAGNPGLPFPPFNIPATPPSPLNPFTPLQDIAVAYYPLDLPNAHQVSHQRTRRAIAGFKGSVDLAKKWHWALDYSHDEDDSDSQIKNYTQFVNVAVATGRYGIFRDIAQYPNTDPILLSDLATTVTNRRKPTIDTGNLRLSGEVLTLPGGEVQVSAGVELRRERFMSSNVTEFSPLASPIFLLFFDNTGETHASREARAGYMELTLPLVGAENRLPFLYELSVSAAVRHEAYGRYEYESRIDRLGAPTQSTVSPGKISDTPMSVAIKYAPSRHFALRASWSEAFVSPTMNDLFAPRDIFLIGDTLEFFDPVLNMDVSRPPNTVTETQGGNPALNPETGYTLNYGLVFTPNWRWGSGLALSLDYFRTTNDNAVSNPSFQTLLSSIPSRITRDANNQVIAYDISAMNVSRVIAAGLDIKLTWYMPKGRFGQFTGTAQGTYYDTYKRQIFPGEAYEQRISDNTFFSGLTLNPPLRFKGQSALFWKQDDLFGLQGSFTAGVTARYTSHYKDRYNTGAFAPASETAFDGDWIPSSTEFDVQFSYSRRSEGNPSSRLQSWLADTKWTLGARNVFDRRPPYSSASGAFYSYYNDPRQRFVYFEVRKHL